MQVKLTMSDCTNCTGLMVTERNWLDVFTWATWGGNANLPHSVEGQLHV
jgi:hypothetical protein